ncbi:MAG: carotenoid 1,2-hydratase, partial [Nitrosomonadaceae bacterium]|nr:carotenoid 1,2-hydratase [Nitrosomonadaceae bacterium]
MQFFILCLTRIGWPQENECRIMLFARMIFFSSYLVATSAFAESPRLPPQFSPVTPDVVLTFPHDFGA